MNKKGRYLFVSGIAVALLAVVTTWKVTADDASGIAFTAEITEQHFGDGGAVNNKEMVLAYRADGSSVRVEPIPGRDGQIVERRTIVDVPVRQKVIVDSVTESLMTFNLAGKHCVDLQGERSTRLGYEVVQIVIKADHGLRKESWHAPALRCAALEEVLLKEEGGQIRHIVERKVTDIRLGEPSPELFIRTPSFVERSPAEFRKELSRRLDVPLSMLTNDGSWDRKYRENR
jgi:hypothetical protein